MADATSPSSRHVAPISIRPARPHDLDGLLSIERAAFTTDHLSRRQYRKHLVSRTASVLVAVDTNGLLGKAVLFFRHGSAIARLYSIAVAERARGRGVGEALLLAAETEALRRGCARLRLEVRQDNAGAMRLYERLGYRCFGSRASYYEDGADAWRYEKPLRSDGVHEPPFAA